MLQSTQGLIQTQNGQQIVVPIQGQAQQQTIQVSSRILVKWGISNDILQYLLMLSNDKVIFILLLFIKINGSDGQVQQIQVLPVQQAPGGQQILMHSNHAQPAQAAQVIMMADGQTILPVQVSKCETAMHFIKQALCKNAKII